MITGIIMACGFSRRMKRNKLLLEINGIPIVERVIKAVKSSDVDKIILIYKDKKIRKIGEKHGIKTVYNDSAEKGQSESMKLGILNAPIDSNGYMLFVGDQPFLDKNTINTLIDEFKQKNNSIIVPLYKGQRGTPAIFSSQYKEKLLCVEGDKGGRDIIKQQKDEVGYVHIDNEITGLDIDTPDEYTRWRGE